MDTYFKMSSSNFLTGILLLFLSTGIFSCADKEGKPRVISIQQKPMHQPNSSSVALVNK